MKIVQTAQASLTFRPQASGGVTPDLRIEDWTTEIDVPVSELLELAAVLPVQAILGILRDSAKAG